MQIRNMLMIAHILVHSPFAAWIIQMAMAGGPVFAVGSGRVAGSKLELWHSELILHINQPICCAPMHRWIFVVVVVTIIDRKISKISAEKETFPNWQILSRKNSISIPFRKIC